MATVDKNFKVKHGLVVEGTTATVNGNDILTTASSIDTNFVSEGLNQYFTAQRAKDAAAALITGATKTNIVITGDGNGLVITAENGVADSTTTDLAEGMNLYFTDKRAQDAVGLNVGTGLGYYYTTGAIYVDTNTIATKTYVNGLASNYDAAGAAATAQSNAETFATNAINALTTNNIQEGLTNLYFTVERAQDAIGLNVGTGLSYDDPSGAISVNTSVIATKTYVDGLATNYDAAGAASTAESNAKLYTDTLIGDPTVNGTSGNTVKARIDSAIAGVVGLAPAALDTLQELAAAFNNSPDTLTNLITTVGGKQTNLTAGTGISLDTLGNIAVDTLTIATVNYVDTNFVKTVNLPPQITDYISNTEKGAPNGVATLDSSGYVPLSQLGNVPAAYITSVGTNLGVTAGLLTISTAPTFVEVDVNSVAKQVASTTTITSATTATVYAFDKSVYRSAKFLVKVAEGTNTEVSEVLLTLDSSNNIAITEYAIVGTNGSLSTISADIDGVTGYVNLKVTTIGSSTVSVSGTLLI